MQAITSQLLYHKPDNPRDFVVRYLENVKSTGTPSLLNAQDLETMFGMFDITNRGVVTGEQALNALKSLLGPAATLNVNPGQMLKKDDFVKVMNNALQDAQPYKKQ